MDLSTLINNIRTIVNGSTIKYTKLAKAAESVESLRAADLYIAALEQTDSYHTYAAFDIEAIESAGLRAPLYDPLQLSIDKTLIPEDMREAVVLNERRIIIRDYVERNNYYRQYMGLPPYEDTTDNFIYLTAEQALVYNTDASIPIHLLPNDVLYNLYNDGVISTITQNNPDKVYLNYMGPKSIDSVKARAANNFSIIQTTAGVHEAFFSMFLTIYEQNREYFSSVLYITEYSASYPLYDNFIGLNIMTMTIQRLVANTFKFGIQRDFYDWSFIQALYKMYNIPFIENLPMDYHIIILKNLNNLLRYKSTDKVLLDIASLLGYEQMKIYRMYLVKHHMLDESEEPVFYYKEVENEDGTTSTILDYERTYTLYLQGVDIREKNVTLALRDARNHVSYNEVTNADPYWWEDDDLKTAVYENDYNYNETKYIRMNMMYKMTKMLFEITYIFRMIQDKKINTDTFRLTIPKLYGDADFSLFEITILMICLICKKNGLVSYTVTNPSMTSHIYGFNFDPDDIAAIRTIINDNADVIDRETLNYLNNLEISTADDANRLFEQIRQFNGYLINKMAIAPTIEEYRLYRKIYTIITVSDIQTDIFTVPDGSGGTRVATSYLDYLHSTNTILADIVDTIVVTDIDSAIIHVVAQLEAMLTAAEYMYILTDNNNPVFRSVSTLINFFKSYTVDMTNFSIMYIFDSKYENLIKLVDEHTSSHANFLLEEEVPIDYSDIIYSTHITDKKRDIFTMSDKVPFIHSIRPASVDIINIRERPLISMMLEYMDYISVDYSDTIKRSHIHNKHRERFGLNDRLKLIWDN